MYFRSIQFLRFFAAAYITLFHMIPWWNQRQDAFTGMFDNGHSGVDLFVISGFVIIQSALALKPGWYSLVLFLKRRLIRIYPMYWVLLASFIVTGFIDPSGSTSNQIWQAVFLLPGHRALIRPSWTLQWELYFYLLSSLLVLDKRFKYLLGILLLLATISEVLPFLHLPKIGIYHPFILEFFMGILAWKLHDKVRVVMAVIMAVTGAILFLFPLPIPLANVFRFGIPCTLLITGLTALEKYGKLVVPLALARLGDASYCLYLIHAPVITKLLPRIIQQVAADRFRYSFNRYIRTPACFC